MYNVAFHDWPQEKKIKKLMNKKESINITIIKQLIDSDDDDWKKSYDGKQSREREKKIWRQLLSKWLTGNDDNNVVVWNIFFSIDRKKIDNFFKGTFFKIISPIIE